MKNTKFSWALLLLILMIGALACNAISNIGERARQIESAAKTAQALATAGQEIITQVEGSGIMQTAEAMATKVEESGIKETIQVVVTEQGSNVKATVDVVLTQGSYGQAPSNIPQMYGEVNDFFASDSLISYTTPMALPEVANFYKSQMPAYGWFTSDEATQETSNYALIAFQNNNQRALITLSLNPLNKHTIVIITIFGN